METESSGHKDNLLVDLGTVELDSKGVYVVEHSSLHQKALEMFACQLTKVE